MYRMSEDSPVYLELVPLWKYIQCGPVPTVPFQTSTLLLHTSECLATVKQFEFFSAGILVPQQIACNLTLFLNLHISNSPFIRRTVYLVKGRWAYEVMCSEILPR